MTDATETTDERLVEPEPDEELRAVVVAHLVKANVVGLDLTAQRIIALVDADRGREVKSP